VSTVYTIKDFLEKLLLSWWNKCFVAMESECPLFEKSRRLYSELRKPKKKKPLYCALS